MPPETDFEKDELIRLIEQKFSFNPGDHYVPNEAQANFIRLFGGADPSEYEKSSHTWVEADRPDNFLDLLVAANGTGKTDVEVLIMGQLIGVIDNPYFYDKNNKLYPFYDEYPVGLKGRIISTPAAIKDTIVPRLVELFPEGTYKKEKRGKEYYSYFEGPRGRFDLMTYEQNASEFESITLNVAFFDEPEERKDIFTATTSRARKGMRIGFVLTPLGKAAWLHAIAIGNTKWTVGTVYAEMEVNCEQHSLRGALQHEHLEEMAAGWGEEEKEARVHGRWMHLIGQVYPMWDDQVHIILPEEIPRTGTIYCACDPHTARPNFFGWFKVCPDGHTYMIKEWPEVVSLDTTRGGKPHTIFTYYEDLTRSKHTFEEYCEIIRKVEDGIGVAYDRVMDGRFGNTAYGDGSKPYYKEFDDRGLNFVLAANDPYLYRGHNRVKAMLHHQNSLGKDPNKRTILPKLFISSECKNTIKSVQNYVYDIKKEGDSEAVKQIWKDPMDVVRMMSDRDDWRWRDPATTAKWRSTFGETNQGSPSAGISVRQ